MMRNEHDLPQSTIETADSNPNGILLVIHAGAGEYTSASTPEHRAQAERDLR